MKPQKASVYEAGALKALLKEGPHNLFGDRAGDGHFEAVESLKKKKWIAENKKGVHSLLAKDEAEAAIHYWGLE